MNTIFILYEYYMNTNIDLEKINILAYKILAFTIQGKILESHIRTINLNISPNLK